MLDKSWISTVELATSSVIETVIFCTSMSPTQVNGYYRLDSRCVRDNPTHWYHHPGHQHFNIIMSQRILILAFQEPCPCTAVTFGSILFVVIVVLVFVMAFLDYIVKRVAHISTIVAPVRRKSEEVAQLSSGDPNH